MMIAVGEPVFEFDPVQTAGQLAQVLEQGKYQMLVAKAGGALVGLLTLYEGDAPFARTLAFFERQDFAVSGGRNLRLVL